MLKKHDPTRVAEDCKSHIKNTAFNNLSVASLGSLKEQLTREHFRHHPLMIEY